LDTLLVEKHSKETKNNKRRLSIFSAMGLLKRIFILVSVVGNFS
jgi:hypothetical protein